MSSAEWRRGLPEPVANELERVVSDANAALQDDLVAIVLFGSAAEGRLRATSDVNLIFVLRQFVPERMHDWRASLQMSAAAIKLEPMLILQSELADALEAFAVKFFDVLARRRVLYGADPFASLAVARDAAARRLRQVLLNLSLRLRHALVLFNEGAQTRAVTDALGPMRVAAMVLLQLEGRPAESPKQALDRVASDLGGEWPAVIAHAKALREQGTPVDARAATTVSALAELAQRLLARTKQL